MDYQVDDTVPSLIIRFKSRKDAEVALLQGRNFTGTSLSVDWHLPPDANQKSNSAASLDGDEANIAQNEGIGSAEEEEEENEVG